MNSLMSKGVDKCQVRITVNKVMITEEIYIKWLLKRVKSFLYKNPIISVY